ncbi:hypothetical protein SDC9_132030 [bioreactor metagenome]|uniref:Uncharacterized protein n=1 Tax=bioreactor metagenome TaxID=1076179 RepID=A0A645D6J0_9ZZZZ
MIIIQSENDLHIPQQEGVFLAEYRTTCDKRFKIVQLSLA